MSKEPSGTLNKLKAVGSIILVVLAFAIGLFILLGMLGGVVICLYIVAQTDKPASARLFALIAAVVISYLWWLMLRICIDEWGPMFKEVIDNLKDKPGQ